MIEYAAHLPEARYCVITPFLVPPGAKRVNVGDGFILDSATRLLGARPQAAFTSRAALGDADIERINSSRALVAMGHSQARISRALGCHPDAVNHLARGTVATVRADLQADLQEPAFELGHGGSPGLRVDEPGHRSVRAGSVSAEAGDQVGGLPPDPAAVLWAEAGRSCGRRHLAQRNLQFWT